MQPELMGDSTNQASQRRGGYRPGDLVEVRSAEEIRAQLDAQGRFDMLPFMPEMVKFCGKRLRVLRRVEKIYLDGHRFNGRLRDVVQLADARCDGAAHGGCQMGCVVLWKEAWLKPATGTPDHVPQPLLPLLPVLPAPTAGEPPQQFSCQATELVHAVQPISPWGLWRYVADWRLGQRSLAELARMVFLMASNKIRRKLRKPLHGMTRGTLEKTPAVALDLQPGELVRVKDREAIRATLDHIGRNRGLVFLPDMVRFCGQTFRVARRIERSVIDFSKRMQEFDHTVALEGVHCSGLSLGACSRGCYHLWREAWLERIAEPTSSAAPPEQPPSGASADQAVASS